MNDLIPDKGLGQHWLNDRGSLESMCFEAKLSPSDVVLEIGPGLGSLTRLLEAKAKKVFALEFDARMVEQLKKANLAANVEVTQGDILKYDLNSLPANYKVVANLPYYITSKIIRLLLEADNPPISATLLVQKEVAERIAAEPGDMSLLSISVQLYAEVVLGPLVPAKLFVPPPQVDSQIITLNRRQVLLYPDLDLDLFFRVVKAGFSEKRKKLRNSLSGGLHIDKSVCERIINSAGLSYHVRAENLALDDWARLVKSASTLT